MATSSVGRSLLLASTPSRASPRSRTTRDAEASSQTASTAGTPASSCSRPALLLAELKAARPDIAEAALAALPAAQDGPVITLDEALFALCPADSIDRAVMERTRRAAVALASLRVGRCGGLGRGLAARARDGDGNLIRGDVWTLDTRGLARLVGGADDRDDRA